MSYLFAWTDWTIIDAPGHALFCCLVHNYRCWVQNFDSWYINTKDLTRSHGSPLRVSMKASIGLSIYHFIAKKKKNILFISLYLSICSVELYAKFSNQSSPLFLSFCFSKSVWLSPAEYYPLIVSFIWPSSSWNVFESLAVWKWHAASFFSVTAVSVHYTI